MLTVAAAVAEVIDDLMEADASGPFSTEKVIRKLNEGLEHCRNLVMQHDQSGEWFGTEATATFPAATRWTDWAGAGKWSAAGQGPPNRILRVQAIISGKAQPVALVDPQDELEWINTHAAGDYALMLMGTQVCLIQGSTEDMPGAVSLRISFIPTFIQINSAIAQWGAESIKVIGADFPFPADHVRSVTAYAVVLLVGKQETPTNFWERRYQQLEQDLLATIFRRRNRQSAPEVRRAPGASAWIINGG